MISEAGIGIIRTTIRDVLRDVIGMKSKQGETIVMWWEIPVYVFSFSNTIETGDEEAGIYSFLFYEYEDKLFYCTDLGGQSDLADGIGDVSEQQNFKYWIDGFDEDDSPFVQATSPVNLIAELRLCVAEFNKRNNTADW